MREKHPTTAAFPFFLVFGFSLICAAASAPALAQEVNIASLGTPDQSTTGFGGDPARAIDGNTDGVYGNNSITHTETGDLAPWWELDLGESFPLTRIVLWNRTDTCCVARLSNFRVTVLDDDLFEVHGESLFTDGVSFPAEPRIEVVLPEGTEGRFVRVDLLGPNAAQEESLYLSLAEVEVFSTAAVDVPPRIGVQPEGGRIAAGTRFELRVEASGAPPPEFQWYLDGDEIDGATGNTYIIDSAVPEDSGLYWVVVDNGVGSVESAAVELVVVEGVNLALSGTASQSTTGFDGAAARGIDGNIDGNYGANSVTHTATGDPTPWWEVDLGAVSAIDRIVLWNRTDCCVARLSNFRVSVLDREHAPVFEMDYFTNGIDYPDTTFEGFEIVEAEGTEGRFVRVELLGPNASDEFWLSLAEVEIFGEPDGGTGGPGLRRGDVDGNGVLEITDPISSLAYQFLGTFAPPCLDALDWDDNGTVEVTDPIASLTRQFAGGTPAAPPGSDACGDDPTADSLSCESYPEASCN